jgi:3D (Asp-Asp-Asp) domain-containing protein
MLLSRSLRRKLLATVLGALAIMLVYQATVIDSRSVPGARLVGITPGSKVQFTATAYCKGSITAAGTAARSGVAAADPSVLPLGSVIQVDDGPTRHNGIYTVLDTGPAVQGRQLDLYMWSCFEALDFGRRPVTVTVLRRGWRPNDAPEAPFRPLDAPPGARRPSQPTPPASAPEQPAAEAEPVPDTEAPALETETADPVPAG